MIELGLARIAQLAPRSFSWKAIHVAGTNGKGSICAYLSAMIKAGGLRSARYTSPHLIDRWDCIVIDEDVVSQGDFEASENLVKAKDHKMQVRASEFELLTATAFQLFDVSRPQIDYGVVEVGLGGRLDATNILSNVEVSVITKIGMDHQAQLGNTIQEIAKEKAGIMRPQVPCIADGTNQVEVIDTLQAHANAIGTPLSFVTADSNPSLYAELQPHFERHDLEPHQKSNLLIACEVIRTMLSRRNGSAKPDIKPFLDGIANAVWPGRLQRISIEPLVGRTESVLLDGAHNQQSAEALAGHVDRTLRKPDAPVTWVFAASRGKDIRNILQCCLRKGDVIIPACFGPVDGMPWVQSMEVDDIASIARNLTIEVQVAGQEQNISLLERLRLASNVAKGGPIAIAGSLYLVSDVLRMFRDPRTFGT